MKEKGKIHIGSIGGGSGNDALAISLFLRKYRHLETPIDVEILDYSHSAWKTCNHNILKELYSTKSCNINFDWSFGDFKEDMGSFGSKSFVIMSNILFIISQVL